MLELASQHGFRERSQYRVSAPVNPRNVDGAGFFDSLGRSAELSERSEPAPGAESAPGSSESRDIGHPRGSVGPHIGRSRRQGVSAVLRGTHNSLIERCLSPITLLGQEPEMSRAHSSVIPAVEKARIAADCSTLSNSGGCQLRNSS
jgi:hypothetical protein